MHSWTQRLLAAATTAGVLLAAACAAASALDAFHSPAVQAQAHVSISSSLSLSLSPRLFNCSELGEIRDSNPCGEGFGVCSGPISLVNCIELMNSRILDEIIDLFRCCSLDCAIFS